MTDHCYNPARGCNNNQEYGCACGCTPCIEATTRRARAEQIVRQLLADGVPVLERFRRVRAEMGLSLEEVKRIDQGIRGEPFDEGDAACYRLRNAVFSDPVAAPEVIRCMSCPESELEQDFLCFADVYEAAAKVAPKYWKILDLGCNQAIQAYLFRDHEQYIGVDSHVPIEHRYAAPNVVHQMAEAALWLTTSEIARTLDPARTFVIVSYVPDSRVIRTLMAGFSFTNVLSYYPASDPNNPLFPSPK